MARTTAPYVGTKGADRCRECSTKAEATVSGESPSGELLTFRVCLGHTRRYLRTAGVSVAADPESNVALCDCGQFVGHAGRAAHRCSAR